MKKFFYISAVALAFIIGHNTTIAQTTVADGNWSNPATWGGTPPTTTGTVVINHKVTLDIDYAHNSGSITVNASGALTGNSSMRGFALNYLTGTASLTVNGVFNVARTLLYSNVITNSGTIGADSLLNYGTLTNNTAAIINATEFTNYVGGTITNDGEINTNNFLNYETVSNTGSLKANDMTNTKNLTNSTTGLMTINFDFLNADTLTGPGPALFTNNGGLTVGHDFQNGANPSTIEGSGTICVVNNSLNRGTMNGTFDFCDQTGGNIDLNVGTIASGITTCLVACTVGLDEWSENFSLSIYPNPFSAEATLQIDYPLNNATLTVVNYFGQTVQQIENISGNTVTLSRKNLTSGLYFIQLTEGNTTIAMEKLVITD